MSTEQINKDSLRAVLARMAINNPVSSTTEAMEAQRILQSIKDVDINKGFPQRELRTVYSNRYLDTDVTLEKIKNSRGHLGPHSISFTTESGYDRPRRPYSRAEQLGIRASINQAIDSLPTARDGTKRNAYYEFEAIEDIKDFANRKPGKTENQRSKMYRRFSKGAMDPVVDPKSGSMIGRGERISDDTWQPRGKKGRVKKHVKWNLAEPVDRLNTIAQQVTRPLQRIANVANRANPYLLAVDLIKEDVEKSRVADGTLKGRTPAEMGLTIGPPAPKSKSKAKSKPVVKAPAKKGSPVLAKKGGQTGTLINGLFIRHPWSFEQQMRYAARK